MPSSGLGLRGHTVTYGSDAIFRQLDAQAKPAETEPEDHRTSLEDLASSREHFEVLQQRYQDEYIQRLQDFGMIESISTNPNGTKNVSVNGNKVWEIARFVVPYFRYKLCSYLKRSDLALERFEQLDSNILCPLDKHSLQFAAAMTKLDPRVINESDRKAYKEDLYAIKARLHELESQGFIHDAPMGLIKIYSQQIDHFTSLDKLHAPLNKSVAFFGRLETILSGEYLKKDYQAVRRVPVVLDVLVKKALELEKSQREIPDATLQSFSQAAMDRIRAFKSRLEDQSFISDQQAIREAVVSTLRDIIDLANRQQFYKLHDRLSACLRQLKETPPSIGNPSQNILTFNY